MQDFAIVFGDTNYQLVYSGDRPTPTTGNKKIKTCVVALLATQELRVQRKNRLTEPLIALAYIPI